MAPLLEVTNLRYRYDDGTEVLQRLDFHLCHGEPTAAGKTTFVLNLNGLICGEGSNKCAWAADG